MDQAVWILVLLAEAEFLMPNTVRVSAKCSAPYCPPPRRAVGGHCYQWMEKSMSWMDAERFCQMLSHPGRMAHLASITSDEEKQIIDQYAEGRGQAVWIGLFNNRDHFQWADGSSVGSLNWQKPGGTLTEPSGDGLCVEWYQAMNDRSCEAKQSFVCKF